MLIHFKSQIFLHVTRKDFALSKPRAIGRKLFSANTKEHLMCELDRKKMLLGTTNL